MYCQCIDSHFVFDGNTRDWRCVCCGGAPDQLAIPVEWNGQRYDSISASARDCGITLGCMMRRFQNGYTSDDDLTPRNERRLGRRVDRR